MSEANPRMVEEAGNLIEKHETRWSKPAAKLVVRSW